MTLCFISFGNSNDTTEMHMHVTMHEWFSLSATKRRLAAQNELRKAPPATRKIVAADDVRDGHMPVADLEPLRHNCGLHGCLLNCGETPEDRSCRCVLGSRGVNVRVSSYAHGCATAGHMDLRCCRKNIALNGYTQKYI